MANRSTCIVMLILLILGCSFFKLGHSQNGTVPLRHIVLVHGMGHGAWAWFEVTNYLEGQGYPVKAIDLVSHGIDKTTAENVKTLVEYTKPLIDHINTIDGMYEVVLVGHDLGGGAISYAAEMFSTRINCMIFVAGIMPKNGQSFFDSFPAKLFPRLSEAGYVVVNNGADGQPASVSLNSDKLGEFFYNKSSPQYIHLAKTLLVPTPHKPADEKLTLTTAYGNIPRYYIRTSDDMGITSEEQDQIIAANPPNEFILLNNTDHAPYFSNPSFLTSYIMGYANGE